MKKKQNFTKIISLSVIFTLCFVVFCWSGAQKAEAVVYDTYHWATPEDFFNDTGKRITEFNEAPMLAEMVRAGTLPPVEERLPLEPLVLAREPGNYSGTIRLGPSSFNSGQYGGIPYMLNSTTIAEYAWTQNTYPNLLKEVEKLDGGRTIIFHLREGARWSDGEPYTADDIMFWWEDIAQGRRWHTGDQSTADPYTGGIVATGVIKDVVRVDDYTVRFEMNNPSDMLFTINFEVMLPAYCKHYMSQFHPKYQDADVLDKMIRDGGFGSWSELFGNKLDLFGQFNTERPVMHPWVMVQAPPDDVIMRRNPYFFAVDAEGNQLPYFDEVIRYITLDPEVANIKTLAGELDFAELPLALIPEAKKREKSGEGTGYFFAETSLNAGALNFNITHRDPARRAIYSDVRFRIAASHAIDRDFLNESLFNGMSEPWQIAPHESSPYYHEGFATNYLEYDPDEANRLLDEIGLDARGRDGYRLLPDGEGFEITMISVDFGDLLAAEMAEIVTDNLKAVGLNVNLRVVEWGFAQEQRAGNLIDAALISQAVGINEGNYWDGYNGTYIVPVHTGCVFYAPEWNKWWLSDGAEGERPSEPMVEAVEYYRAGMATLDVAERTELMEKILDIAADNLWAIGTVKMLPRFKFANPNLRNIPTGQLAYSRGADAGRMELWFVDE